MNRDFAMLLQACCPGEGCRGTTFSVNDGASRMGAALGRMHFKCDTCGSRWSAEVPELPKGRALSRVRPARRRKREPKNLQELWTWGAPKVNDRV